MQLRKRGSKGEREKTVTFVRVQICHSAPYRRIKQLITVRFVFPKHLVMVILKQMADICESVHSCRQRDPTAVWSEPAITSMLVHLIQRTNRSSVQMPSFSMTLKRHWTNQSGKLTVNQITRTRENLQRMKSVYPQVDQIQGDLVRPRENLWTV